MSSGRSKKNGIWYIRQTPDNDTKKTTASRKTAARRQEENAFIRDEIKVLLLFGISVLLLLSTFGIGGAAGDVVSGVLFGLFGIFAYVLPIGLFFVAAFSISNRDNTIAAVKGAAMILAGFLFAPSFSCLEEKGRSRDGCRLLYIFFGT